jgi:hypothetical protein
MLASQLFFDAGLKLRVFVSLSSICLLLQYLRERVIAYGLRVNG